MWRSGVFREEETPRDNFTCTYCGRSAYKDGVTLQIDHIEPKSKGGEDRYDNLCTACTDCNLGKLDVLLERHQELMIKREIAQRKVF